MACFVMEEMKVVEKMLSHKVRMNIIYSLIQIMYERIKVLTCFKPRKITDIQVKV